MQWPKKRWRSQVDVAVAVTGFAGPSGDGDEGLVHFGCARRGRDTLHRETHFGAVGRGPVRVECLRTALEMFERSLG